MTEATTLNKNNLELLRALTKLGDKERIALLECLEDKQVHCICECIYNTLQGNVPLSKYQKRQLSYHKTVLRNLVEEDEPIKKKKRILPCAKHNLLRASHNVRCASHNVWCARQIFTVRKTHLRGALEV